MPALPANLHTSIERCNECDFSTISRNRIFDDTNSRVGDNAADIELGQADRVNNGDDIHFLLVRILPDDPIIKHPMKADAHCAMCNFPTH